MNLELINEKVDNLASAWEDFKSVNDNRLKEIEKKGASDPLTQESLQKINDALDNQKEQIDDLVTYKGRVDELEKKTNRDGLGSENGEFDANAQEYKAAFVNYVRKGEEGVISSLQTKAMSVGSDPDGGYYVTPQMSSDIIKKVFESTPMRGLASIETISTDSMEILEDTDEAAGGWTGETSPRGDTDTPKIGKKTIPVHELFAQPKATQKLLDDSSVDIEAWLAGKVADIFSRKENTAFISGDGSAKPRGILTYDAGTAWGQIEQLNSGSAGNITDDSIIKLFYALKEEYAVIPHS